MKELHFNLFKLLTDANLADKFNRAANMELSHFHNEGTLNGLMINCSNADGTDGIWDASAQAFTMTDNGPLLVLNGRSSSSGSGVDIYANINWEGRCVETNHPSLTAEQLTDFRMYLEPTSAEYAQYLIQEFWDALFSE